MKILIVTHANREYHPDKMNGAWQFLAYYFRKKGHKVREVKKKRWIFYPFIYIKFNPDVIISIGKFSGIITSLHRKFSNKLFVHDLTDHPYFYGSEKRIHFICKNHDILVTTSKYNYDRYKCHYLISNGSNFTPIKDKIKWDACYLGQIHSFYKIDKLVRDCKEQGIKLKLIYDVPTKDVPNIIAKSSVCVYTISWDSSTKMYDYAAMAKAIVAIKPNLAEKINFPAYYTKDLAKGIKFLLKNKKKITILEKKSRQWFLNYSGTWEEQAFKYLNMLNKELKIFTMDVEKNIENALKFALKLKKKKIKGEFYITGKLVENYPKEVKIIAKNHIIGGHGYEHERFGKLTIKEQEEVIKKTINIFKKNNIKIQGWRFPYLSFNNDSLKLIKKYNLYDSSINKRRLFGRFYIKNYKINLLPKNLIERSWDYSDEDKNILKKIGRLILHDYNYQTLKNYCS